MNWHFFLPHLLLDFCFTFNCLRLCIWIWMSWYYSQDIKRIRVEKSQHSMPAAASQDPALLHSCLVLLKHFIHPHRFSLSKTLKRGRRVARGGGRVTLSWVDPHPRGLNPATSQDIKQHPPCHNPDNDDECFDRDKENNCDHEVIKFNTGIILPAQSYVPAWRMYAHRASLILRFPRKKLQAVQSNALHF